MEIVTYFSFIGEGLRNLNFGIISLYSNPKMSEAVCCKGISKVSLE